MKKLAIALPSLVFSMVLVMSLGGVAQAAGSTFNSTGTGGDASSLSGTETNTGTGDSGSSASNQIGTGDSGQVNTQGTTLLNPLGTGYSLNSLLVAILQFVVRIGSIVVILMLVYVGYLFVVAQGNESKLTEARRALLWTIIGALILLGSEGIAQGIQATVQALSTGSGQSSIGTQGPTSGGQGANAGF